MAQTDRLPHDALPSAVLDGVHLTRTAGSLIARLEGDACLDSEAMLRHLLLGSLMAAARPSGAPGPPLELVLDLSGVTFCDLRGLDVLTDTVEVGKTIGVAVTVTNAPPALERMRCLLGGGRPWASHQGPDVPSSGSWWERPMARLRTAMRR